MWCKTKDIFRNFRLFCIESLFAYARMSTVTLINLPFIEVVFFYISLCNAGRARPAGSPHVGVWAVTVPGACQQSYKSSAAIDWAWESHYYSATCVRPMYTAVAFTVLYVNLLLMPFNIIQIYFVHSIHPCSRRVNNSYEHYAQLQKKMTVFPA